MLEQTGYQVTTTRETSFVSQLAGRLHFDAVVICNSIPINLRESLARELKRLIPALPLVIICGETRNEQDRFRGWAEEIVLAQDGNFQQLIDAIARVVQIEPTI